MKSIVIFLFFVGLNSHAQNTVSLPENVSATKTDISENKWMEGHWKGLEEKARYKVLN
ncbi:hypothetical protein SAMN05421636_101271 [Pricia antarctica]|uniref:Uncharacterized protein n=1 Tax=Pricia antarctica TaxID=641691 RepID=A0A1G6WEQ9_9FLAO|nr:hypothetical protein [Pricia antarctica]SDD63727.1 hypothetical protein SAMN05421636_101271 [Pricia antarctica]